MFFTVLPAVFALLGIAALADAFDDDDNSSSTPTDPLTGGADADDITGTDGNDLIQSAAGNDNVSGGDGNDTIRAGADNDVAVGGAGDDLVRGEAGNDLLIGNEGSDRLFGDTGNDWVEGDAGDDTVAGGLNEDILLGGTGSDNLVGGGAADILFGGSVTGTPLTDAQLSDLRDGTALSTILGVSGDTVLTLVDDAEADTLTGDFGQDTLILGAGDTGTGGDQQDTFQVFAAQDAMAGPATITDFAPSESIALIVQGGATPTVTVADDGADAVISADGQEVARVTGQAGNISAADIALVDGPTVDDLDPNNATTVTNPNPTTTQTLTAGDDTFTGSDGVQDNVDGGDGNDILLGEGENDRLRGEAGSDILDGSTGADRLVGGAGEDYAQGGARDDSISGGSEDDWLNGGAGNDAVDGNSQDDAVIGGRGEDVLTGGNGADLLVGGEALDRGLTQAELIQLRDGTATSLTDFATLGIGTFDDQSVDSLNGGNGDDTLIMAHGDTGIGGAGEDAFYLAGEASGATAGLNSAVISDYNSTDDSIVVILPTAMAPGVVTVTQDGADAIVSLDGAEYARVTGAAATLTAADVQVTAPLTVGDIDQLADPGVTAVNNQTLTANADTFTGTDGVSDRINALAGDDTVDGAGGDDRLQGREGADILLGGTGNDQIFGSSGTDFIQGNEGDDAIEGGAEVDYINGGPGDDVLTANAGNDLVIGGAGADNISGNNNGDVLVGGDFYSRELTAVELDTLRTGGTVTGLTPGALEDNAVDILNGGASPDFLIGAAGDSMIGGGGADVFAGYSGAAAAAEIEDFDDAEDGLAVVFDNGAVAPTITITDDGSNVYTVFADGNPVIIVATTGTPITAGDVALIERNADGSVDNPI